MRAMQGKEKYNIVYYYFNLATMEKHFAIFFERSVDA